MTVSGPIIDLMMHVPDGKADYAFLKPLLRGANKGDADAFPAKYMFKDAPEVPPDVDVAAYIVAEMDKYGIARSMIDVTEPDSAGRKALNAYPDRFLGSFGVDPNLGMSGVAALAQAHAEGVVVAATAMPAAYSPPVAINDKRFYPLYAKCAELGIPFFVTVGIPGPRVPFAPQHVELLDEVCWFFPELKIVMRHGAEPWTDLAARLMLRWPNLYYSTSAFAPKYYPKAIIDFANTRGRDKVLYAGYFPAGLTLERIFRELPDVPFREEVWPYFLYKNAQQLLGLTD